VECRDIVVTPAGGRVLRGAGARQQIGVTASFTDGTSRDVSAIASFESSHPSVATVDENGLVTARGRGQAAISVRYLDKLESVLTTVVVDVPGFAWKPEPVNGLVDRLVNAKLKQLRYLPGDICTDDVFLRRISLDLTGMLPSPERARRFLKDPNPVKRSLLVDELLQTEEFARFQALKKADLMRVSRRRLGEGLAEGFSDWLVGAMRSNMPYDRFAREILTASGDALSSPAASYYVAIPTVEERTEMTSQLFMGSRVECAKCHNHPFESWTMRDYYRIAAVFARTQADNGLIRLAAGGETLHPTSKEKMLSWGMEAGQPEPADRRARFADWLTGPDNPLFARVEVNRIWADLMGRGIVDPVDDFRSSNPPSNAPLLDALATEFKRSGYDRRHVIRLICQSRAYQRSGRTNRFNETDETLFSHAKVRQLTAEQLKDAIALTTRVLDAPPASDPRLPDAESKLSERAAALEPGFQAWLARPRHPEPVAALIKIPAERRSPGQTQRLKSHYLNADQEYRARKQERDRLAFRLDYATQRPFPEASEFTTTFGQPARETACTCERQSSPTLLQALELLNGAAANRMVRDGAVRYAAMKDPELVEELYLRGLSRLPTQRERDVALRHLAAAKDRPAAVTDLLWSFINLREFLFQH
jgi:hypothetical protein